jgi:pantetheine-phosphate adenylyltransferase
MSKAIYAGSFDPFTFGHLSVALNAARLFDEVVILVAINTDKNCLFTAKERVELINKVIRGNDNIIVDSTKGYVVQYARREGASYMVRGIRNDMDAKSELMLSELNTALAPEVQTVFLPANQSLATVSSSKLKRDFSEGVDVRMYCAPEVIKAMRGKIS